MSDVSLGAAMVSAGGAVAGGVAAHDDGVAVIAATGATCVVAFIAYAAALGPPSAATPAARLLVLRVFATHGSAARLLDELQTRWRLLGPVNQIGGFDLAATNLDAREALLFWTGRTHDLFLPGALSPAELVTLLEDSPDAEGRFRVNEVFCFDTAWKQTVEGLIDISDAILLGLRGFAAANRGAWRSSSRPSPRVVGSRARSRSATSGPTGMASTKPSERPGSIPKC
jgi:hypothetical protein